jgi:hypothetical protein
MQRTLLSLAAVGSIAASLSAQCAPPTGTQSFFTIPFVTSTTVFADPNSPPLYAMNIDPGPGIRFDLVLNTDIDIASIGTNFWCDGQTAFTPPMTFDNLIGGPNGTMEVWIAPSDTVLNTALQGTYLIGAGGTAAPTSPVAAGWTRLSNLGSHLNNLAYAAIDAPSLATFSPPLHLTAGQYAVMTVFIPQGVATGTAALPTMRTHSLMTNLNLNPSTPTPSDAFMALSNIQLASPADGGGFFSPAGGTPYMPHLNINYNVGANVAYQTPYGAGCYDRKQTFYESFLAPGTVGGSTIDLSPGSISMFNIGNSYIVNTGAGTFPQGGITPGSTTYYDVLGAGATPTHVNTGNPAVTLWGDWDDATSVPYALPFPFSYPGDGGTPATQICIGGNGAIWLAAAGPGDPRFVAGGEQYGAWLAGPPSFAVGYCDLYPADLATFLGGTGDIYIDSDGSTYVTVSFVGVTEYPNAANTGTNNNFQITLTNSNSVELTYGNVSHSNSSLLVGFTPGNGAPDPGSGATPRQAPDLSVAASGPGFLSGDGAAPANIRLSNRPQVGQPLTFNTTNVDASVLANLTIVSASSLPGIDLGFLGMAGCGAWVNVPEVASLFQLGAGPYSWAAMGAIPAAFAGADLFAQSVQFSTSAPPFNSANLLTSDAICIHFDSN